MKPYIFALLIASAAGCASVAPPKEVASIPSSASFADTAALLWDMARQCWTTQVNPLKHGIRVDGYVPPRADSFVISGRRISWGTGLARDPFIVVTIRPVEGKTMVAIHEGDFAVRFANPFRLDAAPHVAAWLDGDRTCKDFASTLWHG